MSRFSMIRRRLLALALCLALVPHAHAQSANGARANNYAGLGQSHIPFVIASATVGSNGALTAITAQAVAWASGIYLWCPANTLSASNPAGWYFVGLTSATAGQAFNNTYIAPGNPVSPTPLVPFVGAAGGNITAITTEVAGPQFTVPANAMGANGAIITRYLGSTTNNANAKSVISRFGSAGTGGTQFSSANLASASSSARSQEIANAGATNGQVGTVSSGFGTGSGTTTATGIVDTTVNQTLSFTLQLGTNTDTMALVFADVDLRYAP